MAEIRWFGHNCFRIRAKEATILTDPVGRITGYSMPRQSADIVTLSHGHPGHANLDAVKPDYKTVRGPGEYELNDVFITGIRTYHDAERGKVLGYNTVYLIEVEGMVICHLGDLGHTLTEEQAEAMSAADVLMAPVGGNLIDLNQAAEVIARLEPKLVIPMQFATDKGDAKLGPLEPFGKALAVELPQPEEKLVLRSSDLSEVMRIVVLAPESEAVRR